MFQPLPLENCFINQQTPFVYFLHRSQCYCGVESDDPSRLGEATCDVDCAGDASQTCGGRFAISVYQYIVLEPEFLGCWTDSKSNRIMDTVQSSNAMTNDVSWFPLTLHYMDARYDWHTLDCYLGLSLA